MFEGFERRRLPGEDGVEINALIGGSGPPLLLLHGFPQSHVMWHRVAPILAPHNTLVIPDLRGYGDSDKPASDAAHSVYSKRATGDDQIAIMRHLGFKHFDLVGWDRGARVAHRMAADHPNVVDRVAVIDIAPTREMLAHVNMMFAIAYYHWWFLVQPYDFPERTILADPENFVLKNLGAAPGGMHEGMYDSEALAEYIRCYKDPAVVHATCEDYRAMVTIDLRHDDEDDDRKIEPPLLALWGEHGIIHTMFDAQTLWRKRAQTVRAEPLPGGHFLCEEVPEIVASRLLTFFS